MSRYHAQLQFFFAFPVDEGDLARFDRFLPTANTCFFSVAYFGSVFKLSAVENNKSVATSGPAGIPFLN